MRELPEVILAMYEHRPDRVRYRPWWQKTANALVRTDGRACGTYHPDYLRDIDCAEPLPFPGFRTGQIWATEDGYTTHVQYAGHREMHVVELDGFHRDWLIKNTLPFAERHWFLLHDPLMPLRAPWAPVVAP